MIYNHEYQLNESELSTFRGIPQRMIWPQGVSLYRLMTPGQNRRYSPFWFSKSTFNQILAQMEDRGLSFEDVARPRLAVKKEWNTTMSQLCMLSLLEPVYVWKGPTKYQPHSDGYSNVLLMGGLEQILVPNLVTKDSNGEYEIYSAIARITYHGNVPERVR